MSAWRLLFAQTSILIQALYPLPVTCSSLLMRVLANVEEMFGLGYLLIYTAPFQR